MTLSEMLSTVEDPRSGHGLRHLLPDVLLIMYHGGSKARYKLL